MFSCRNKKNINIFLVDLCSTTVIWIVGYEGGLVSNQPNIFPVEIHLFFFDVIAL